MDVQQLADGLWRWTAPHPNWKPGKDWPQAVAAIYHEAADAIVLIDPIVPPPLTADADKFWSALDRDVERSGLPVTVLVGNAYHGRNAREIYQRFAGRTGATIYVPAAARGRLAFEPTHTFADGDALPGGVRAHVIDGLDVGETAFHVADRATLVFADAVIGCGNGRVRVAPESWTDETQAGRRRYRQVFRDSLRRLLELDFDRLLPSHGEPVVRGGHGALAEALRAPAWTEEPS